MLLLNSLTCLKVNFTLGFNLVKFFVFKLLINAPKKVRFKLVNTR